MHVGIGGLPDDVSDHLGSETVVFEEDGADSGDQDAGCHLVDEPELHIPHLHVSPHVRDRTEPDQHPSQDDNGDDTCCDPTDYIHPELLSWLTALASSGSTSSGAKYRYRPYESGISTSGSSSTMTPTYCWPSTSSCTEVTRAVLPAKKMSCASARWHGRSRTLLPAATRTPFTSTASRSGRTAVSATGSHQSTPSGTSGIRPADLISSSNSSSLRSLCSKPSPAACGLP